jgi:hypothetical protein
MSFHLKGVNLQLLTSVALTKNGSCRHKDTNFRWMRSSRLMTADVTEFQATEAYSSLDLIKVKYKNNKQ